MKRLIHFDEGAKGFLVLLLLCQLFLTNGILLVVGALLFGVIFYNIQQPYKPAVFTMVFIYHFLQVIATIWLSNYIGKDLNYRSENTETAIICSYIGLAFLFGPIIYFQNKIPALSGKRILEDARKMDINRTFKVYLVAFFSMNALQALAFLFQGLTQVIFSLIKIKWFLFVLLGYQALIKKQKRKEFWGFAIFEFVSGFYSYFSDFKTVIFFVVFVLFFFLRSITLRPLVVTLVAAVAFFFMGAYFQGIKGEYRSFLNGGSKAQVVSVEKDEALTKLMELAQDQKEGTFDKSMEEFLDRMQYTYHLAKTMERVPKVIPYQNGDNIGSTFSYVFTPRILNPDKPAYEASVKAMRYTGISYARAAQGVSVSLGYFADGYIDFGIVGMFFPLLILGFIYGSTYFYFVRHSSHNFLFNFAVVCAMYMEFFAYEMDLTFMLGRIFATLVTFLLLKIFFFPWLIEYLKPRKKHDEIRTRLPTQESNELIAEPAI